MRVARGRTRGGVQDGRFEGLTPSRQTEGGGRLFLWFIQQPEKALAHLAAVAVGNVEAQVLAGVRGFAEQGAGGQDQIDFQAFPGQGLGMVPIR